MTLRYRPPLEPLDFDALPFVALRTFGYYLRPLASNDYGPTEAIVYQDGESLVLVALEPPERPSARLGLFRLSPERQAWENSVWERYLLYFKDGWKRIPNFPPEALERFDREAYHLEVTSPNQVLQLEADQAVAWSDYNSGMITFEAEE